MSGLKSVGWGVVGTMVHNFFVEKVAPRLLTARPYGAYPMGMPGYSGYGYGGAYGGYGQPGMGWFPQTEGEGEN